MPRVKAGKSDPDETATSLEQDGAERRTTRLERPRDPSRRQSENEYAYTARTSLQLPVTAAQNEGAAHNQSSIATAASQSVTKYQPPTAPKPKPAISTKTKRSKQRESDYDNVEPANSEDGDGHGYYNSVDLNAEETTFTENSLYEGPEDLIV